jgi:hypothetical protein
MVQHPLRTDRLGLLRLGWQQPGGGVVECTLTRSACATSEEPASLQAGKPVLGIPGVLNAGGACASSVLARTACSRRLVQDRLRRRSRRGQGLGAAAWSIRKPKWA